MAVDKNKNTQILVTFPNELVKQIEDYWFKNKLKNRNEAIRELVRIGLEKSSQNQK
jgi:metal-responsive CopG/Arc/MetJ family transcriptional regulator